MFAFYRLSDVKNVQILCMVTSRPSSFQKTLSSLERGRSALRFLRRIVRPRDCWRSLWRLTPASDPELVVMAPKLGVAVASWEERECMVRRLTDFLVSARWYLHEDKENVLTAFYAGQRLNAAFLNDLNFGLRKIE